MKKLRFPLIIIGVLLLLALVGFPLGEACKPLLWACVMGIAVAMILGATKVVDQLLAWAIGLFVVITAWTGFVYVIRSGVAQVNVDQLVRPAPGGAAPLGPPVAPEILTVILQVIAATSCIALSVLALIGLFLLFAKIRAALPPPPVRPRPTFRTRSPVIEPLDVPRDPWDTEWNEALPSPDLEDDLGLLGDVDDEW